MSIAATACLSPTLNRGSEIQHSKHGEAINCDGVLISAWGCYIYAYMCMATQPQLTNYN